MEGPIITSIVIAAQWAVYLAVFAGVGRMLLRRIAAASSPGLFDCAWVGILGTVGALQIWHIFLPIGVVPFALLAGVAATEILLHRPAWLRGRTPNLAWLAGTVFVLWIAYQCLDDSFSFDSEVYHFATIRWNEEHALVPGLGNLFIYFGLNQSYFLLAALLDHASLFSEGCLSLNGIFVALAAAECLSCAARVVRAGSARVTKADVFMCLALPLVLKQAGLNLSSPSPDVVVNILVLRSIGRLIRVFEDPNEATTPGIVVCCCLAAAGITLKASLAGIAAGLLLAIAALVWRRRSTIPVPGILLRSAAVLLFFLVPFFWRGILATGYPLFPSPLLGVAVDWRIPVAEVNQFSDYIRGFARTHEHGGLALRAATGWAWIGPWLHQNIRTLPVLTFLGSAAALACIIPLTTRPKRDEADTRGVLWVSIPVTLGILFWLATAPDVRFGGYVLYAGALWMLTIAFERVRPRLEPRHVGRAIVGVSVVAATVIVISSAEWRVSAYPRAPRFPLREQVLASGLAVSVPAAAPLEDEWRIGYATPLATARPPSNLALRSGSLSGGFTRLGRQVQPSAATGARSEDNR